MDLSFPPVVREGQNFWTRISKEPTYFRCAFQQPMPLSSRSTINFGAITAAAPATAKGTQNTLLVSEGRMYQIRVMAIDDAALQLYLPGEIPLWNGRNWQAEVDRFTGIVDPSYASTEIFVLGKDRDVQFIANNRRQTNLARSRFTFWGHRFVITKLSQPPLVIGPFVPTEAES